MTSLNSHENAIASPADMSLSAPRKTSSAIPTMIPTIPPFSAMPCQLMPNLFLMRISMPMERKVTRVSNRNQSLTQLPIMSAMSGARSVFAT